ncbi:hypothetical protein GE09DRAFT_1234071 [Coniochaeta sp. 2T2.1]|nr:hypothetical protein GE09DRAFT_1234071 [Coniochaeta sp. 2T2.1]
MNPSTTGQPSATGPTQYTALCQFYPYTRCKYARVIQDNNEKMIKEWKDHMYSHYGGTDDWIDDTLYCWFKDCEGSEKHKGFKLGDHQTGLKFIYEFLDHMLSHFQNEHWRKREDLRVDEWHIAAHAWESGELWNACHDPDLKKQTEPLPKKTFDQLCDLLEIYGIDKNKPGNRFITKWPETPKVRLEMIRAFNEKYDDKLVESTVMGRMAYEEATGNVGWGDWATANADWDGW